VTEDRDWAAVFDESFGQETSSIERRIWRQVFGDEYPEELDTYSYLSRTELARFVEETHLSTDDLLADIGCGRGGPGLWVIAQTGARLVGIDISKVALEGARSRAESMGLSDRSTWRVGSFQGTGLEGRSLDAVMSVDALLFAPDKEAAIQELARVLRPGGRLVLTTWDYHSQPKGRPPQLPDHRPLLDAAGFEVLAYEDTVDWRQRELGTNDGLLAAVDELAAESGEDPSDLAAALQEMRQSMDATIARRLIVAHRR